MWGLKHLVYLHGNVHLIGRAPQQASVVGNDDRVRAVSPQVGGDLSQVPFLASPKASYVTGAVIAADGGRTAV